MRHRGMDKAVLLLSGGMDSSTLLFYVTRRLGVKDVHTLSFVYGQKHARELAMARWQAHAAGIGTHVEWTLSPPSAMAAGSALTDYGMTVPDLVDVPEADRNQPSTYVPNRNMMLLSLAAAYAESQGICDVFYGAQAQDRYGYWDCTPEFVERMNAVLALNRKRPIQVHAPFARKSKADIVGLGRELGVDYDHTWSCYRGGETPCGACPSCVERNQATGQIEN